jgi:hypothetical protein
VANENVDVQFDQHALEVFLLSVEADILPDLAEEVAAMARSIAPVRVRHTPIPARSKRVHVGVGGRMKASVQWDVDQDYLGLFADIAALWYGRFLDPPARQMKRLHPFLPTALITVLDGREIHLD